MAYYLFILAIGAERLVELAVARRNAAWSIAHGGKEFDRGHYPVMVGMHGLLLVACIVEVWALHRPFIPWLGWTMVVVVLLSQALRWWCISVLGRQWNTRVIVVPGLHLVARGPYRWIRHPNYVAVVAEGIALPLVHTAWLTALIFTVLNIPLLAIRIRCEDAALNSALVK